MPRGSPRRDVRGGGGGGGGGEQAGGHPAARAAAARAAHRGVSGGISPDGGRLPGDGTAQWNGQSPE
eukprot:611519-Prorocentrum_minimum.AAC.1